MRWIAAIVFASCAVSCAGIAQGEPTVTVSVQSNTVRLGEAFAIRVEAVGGSVGSLDFPEVDGLQVDRGHIQRGSSFKIVGSQVSSNVTQVYHAVATRTGEIEIPAIGAEVGGKTVYSDPLKLSVVEGGTPAPHAQPRQRSAAQSEFQGRTADSQDAPTWDDLVFLDAKADKDEVYEGEAITLTMSLWEIVLPGVRLGSPLGFRATFPGTQGFIAVPETPEEVQPRVEQREKWSYQVNRWVQTLYPTAPGELTIPAWQWESVAEAWTSAGPQQKQYHLASEPIRVRVKPLPERPANFSGAIGTFGLDASLKRTEVIQGVPTELTIVIRGKGNPSAIGDVPLPKIDGVYMGDPQKNSKVDPVTMAVTKTSVYAITPLQPGTIVIPEIEFCFFNPETGSFETLKKGPFTITALQAAQPERVFDDQGLGLGGQKVTLLSEDIMPIVTASGSLRRHNGGIVFPLAVTVTPVLAYSAFALVMTRKRRFAGDRGYARSHRAVKKVRAQLDALPNTDGAADVLYRALIGYVADKLDVSEAGLTSADVHQFLDSSGVDSGLAENFLRILRRCERSRYASAALTPDEAGALTEGARTCISRLDTLLKNGRRS